MNLGYVIAIDGPSGAGKSTVARELAARLQYRYIDTGAMYRAAALAAGRRGVDVHRPEALAEFLETLVIRQETRDGQTVTFLGDEDVSEPIRTREIAMRASAISALAPVRDRMTALQRKMGGEGGVVMEGRDIGTVVFPDADFKFFLTAGARERARRRMLELREKGEKASLEAVLAEIEKRDRDDSTREVAPLKRAPDAIDIDCTSLDAKGVVEEMIRRLAAAGGGKE